MVTCFFKKNFAFTVASAIISWVYLTYPKFLFQVFLFIQLLQVQPLQQLMWTLMLFLEENLQHQSIGLQVVKTSL